MKALYHLTFLLFLLPTLMQAQVMSETIGNVKILGRIEISDSPSTSNNTTRESLKEFELNRILNGVEIGANTSARVDLHNMYIGDRSGENIDDGVDNTFIGLFAGSENTSGIENVFLGKASGMSNATGLANTFIGRGAGLSNTNGNHNTFLGRVTGLINTTGISNVFLGSASGFYNVTGNYNTFLGRVTGYNNDSGYFNTYVGMAAGRSGTTGFQNTFLGGRSGFANIDGSNNICIGYESDLSARSLSNAVAIGYKTIVNADNKIRLGNDAITIIEGPVNFSAISDRNLKKNITNSSLGIQFINKLRPVNYEMKSDPSGITYTGFIAQEVEEAVKKTKGSTFSGVVKPSSKNGFYSLRYAEFVVPLVKATQEQQEVIEKQTKELQEVTYTVNDLKKKIKSVQKDKESLKYLIDQQQSDIENLSLKVDQLLALLSSNEDKQEDKVLLNIDSKLSQNRPNPFTQETTIDYFIPTHINSALIQIGTIEGKIIQEYPISTKGIGQLTFVNNNANNTVLYYSLILDGDIVETKKMYLHKK